MKICYQRFNFFCHKKIQISRTHHLTIYQYLKYTIYLCIYYVNLIIENRKVIVWINKIYLCIHTNLIIYVIITDFSLSNIYIL